MTSSVQYNLLLSCFAFIISLVVLCQHASACSAHAREHARQHASEHARACAHCARAACECACALHKLRNSNKVITTVNASHMVLYGFVWFYMVLYDVALNY